MIIILLLIVLIIVMNIIYKLSKNKTRQYVKDTNINSNIPPGQIRTLKRYSIGLPEGFDLNEEFQSAFNLMENSNDCIFITGKAGTGKSTLLQYFRQKTRKKVAVLAFTGVAAVNVNGQTVHSFFGFPPRFIQIENIRRRRNRELLKEIDTIIIDEVSMVRADLMDGIDYALRINRDKMNVPFGGVQVLFFGDLFQLSPIVDPEMRDVFDQRYRSPFFFSADIFTNFKLKYIELNKIYRQKDEKFISLLDRIRNKECTKESLSFLNERIKDKTSDDPCCCITLTTSNPGANEINRIRLDKIPAKEYQYQASIVDEFDESSYPTERCLRLKKGAQIMLIKNDPDKRWVNGTLGEVSDLSNNCIKASIDNKVYEIPKAKWEKIKYTYNEKEKKIEEEVMGSFEQYPIKLAWAITIHKSQGQTFDTVIIDLENGAFTHGQVYVALSRCKSLEGITLKRPVIYSDIIFDERIYEFRKKIIPV